MKASDSDLPVSRSPSLGQGDLYSSIREAYRPNSIHWLLIAESPPSSGGYFYFRWTIGKDHLFRETMKALDIWPQSQVMSKGIDKSPYLERFMRGEFFLIDTCEGPVDKLPPRDRRLQIARGASLIADKVRYLNPDRILIVKKTVFGPVQNALCSAGFQRRILNETAIPFPSHGHQARYRSELRRLTQQS